MACTIKKDTCIVKSHEMKHHSKIKTYVFFDLETSGFNCMKERIIELAMIAVSDNDLINMKKSLKNDPPSLPRVVHKYTKLYYPKVLIDPGAEKVHGLNNYNLEHLSEFTESSAESIKSFLDLPSPVCLLAHNGNRYDFPILKAELGRVIEGDLDILCVDTLICARELEIKVEKLFDKSKNGSNSLDTTDKYLELDGKIPDLNSQQSPVKKICINGVCTSNPSQIELNSTNLSIESANHNSFDTPKKFTNGNLNSSLQEYNQLSDAEKVDCSLNLYFDKDLSDDDNVQQPDPSTKYQSSPSIYKTPERPIFRANKPDAPIKLGKTLPSTSFTPPSKQCTSSIKNKSLSKVKRSLNYSFSGECKLYQKPFSQPVLYRRLFGIDYNAHRAECDAEALLKICSFYGQEFLNWADENYTEFKDVKPRWTMKKTYNLEVNKRV